MRLSELKTGQEATIIKILGHGAFRKRVIEMGFVRGKTVKVMQNAPLKDPIKYKILDYDVSLRRSEAELIEIQTEIMDSVSHLNTINDVDKVQINNRADKTINIALIGNPNCGKTSIFNYVSGAHQHVGNYSGVTVDSTTGYVNYKGYKLVIVDLPGTYSLSAYSPEELYVRRYLKEQVPDVIVNVVVASNLERNLYLSTELIDMDRSMVIALNMYDELKKSGAELDEKMLGNMIGVPIIPTISKKGEGFNDLFDAIIKVYEDRHEAVRHVHVNLGAEIEAGIKEIKDLIKQSPQPILQFSPRYLAIKLLDKDKEVENMLQENPNFNQLIQLRDKWVKHIESSRKEDISSAIASEKYGYIAGALKETMKEPAVERKDNTHIIDAFVTNKLFGFPIFLLLMWFMFWATFELGAYPLEWIKMGIGWVSDFVREIMAPGPLKDLIIDGVIGGVGGVIVFLPNILILYFLISFMEDSGYMARASFIMDRIMHKIGLHGKSFIPLIMGFGCNVPAIMAARSIESRSSRLITILINPFMSCSARIPLYVLLSGLFFPEHSATVFVGLYVLGILVAILTAKLLRKVHYKKDETPFVMELPPYRLPSLKTSLRHMWNKGEQYLKKMGGVILIGSIIVWFLSYFPRDLNVSSEEMTETEVVEQQTNSYLAEVGKFITPVVEPCGMNWKMSVALVSGASAKEIVVSTLGVLYPAPTNSTPDHRWDNMTQINPDTNEPDFTQLKALSFMVFVLLYFPCIAAVIAIAKEAGGWKYGLFTLVYNTFVAWLFSFAVYRIGILFI